MALRTGVCPYYRTHVRALTHLLWCYAFAMRCPHALTSEALGKQEGEGERVPREVSKSGRKSGKRVTALLPFMDALHLFMDTMLLFMDAVPLFMDASTENGRGACRRGRRGASERETRRSVRGARSLPP